MIPKTPKTAVILAGGTTVLNGLQVAGYPKLFLPIADHLLVDYQVSILSAAGVRRLIICVDADQALNAAAMAHHLKPHPLRAEFVLQETMRGTGGTLGEVRNRIEDDLFWVLSGDLLCNADLRQMFSFHLESKSVATVAAVVMEEPPWQMERVEMTEARTVKAIHRIHPMHSRRSKLRPVGLYLFNRSVLDAIPEQGYYDLKEQLFSELHGRSSSVHSWEVQGYCRTISSFDDYFAATQDCLLQRASFPFLPPRGDARAPSGASSNGTRISPTADILEPVTIGAGAQVADRAMLIGPTVIGSGCRVGEGAVLNSCITFKNTKIGRGAHLTNCILCDGAQVQEGSAYREAIILDGAEHIVSNLPNPAPAPFGCNGLLTPTIQRKTKRRYFFWKRFLDVFLSLTCLSVLFPVLALTALAVKIDSPGEVVFRQRRCGQYGREFIMYKFRSMVSNAEDVKRQISDLNEVDGPMFKITEDPRITRVGHFIRRTNLDELPQLWNIAKGDMSLVGPRPLSREEMHYNPRWRDVRLSVRPGLTGLWQVNSHLKPTFVDWIQNDIDYSNNCNLSLDFKILVGTVKNAWSGLLGRMVF